MPLVDLGIGNLHTAAGFVSLASLGVAVFAAARARWLRRRVPAPIARAVSDVPYDRPTIPHLPAQGSEARGFDDDEPTFVGALPQLEDLTNEATAVQPAVAKAAAIQPAVAKAAAIQPAVAKAAAIQPPRTGDKPHILLVCEDGVEPDEATSPHARILVTASGVTDRGRKRTVNEDCFLLMHDHAVFAVADGMGGYNGGEIASSLAVNTIREAFEAKTFGNDLQSNQPLPRRSRELASALLEANRSVSELARQKPELSEMGTTLVAARFSPNKQRVYVANVGDSRCYRLRAGKLTQLTTDHTMSKLGDRGPTKNQLYRAIGVKPIVDIDVVVDVPFAEDVYLLCSDGLPKMASSQEIRDILLDEPDLELAAHRLIELANAAGGRDNVTVVLVRVQDRVSLSDRPELARQSGLVQHSSRRDQTGRRAVNGTG